MFEVGPEKYRKEWESIHRSVFRLPINPIGAECESWNFQKTESKNRPEWSFFPEPIFQPSYGLAFFDENVLNWEEGFEKLRDVTTTAEDDYFGFARLPAPPRAIDMRFYEYPVDISWEDFSSRGEKSPSSWATTFNFHLVGDSKKWGVYYAEACSIYILGFSSEDILSAAQIAFDFEGRNLELIESMDFGGWGGLQEQQERRLRELAEKIRRGEEGQQV